MKTYTKLTESKLIGLVKKLLPEDLKQVDRFLKSPYHNSNKILVPFFEIIAKEYPHFSHPKFTAKNIYRKLYPTKTFNEGSFKGLKTDLIKKIENYIVFEEVKQEKAMKESFMIKAYARRNNYIKFRDASEKLNDKIEQNNQKVLEDFQQLLGINHALFFHPETDRDGLLADRYITSCMNHLDSFYFFSKIVYSIELLTRNQIQQQQHNIKLLEESIRWSSHTELRDHPLFKLYVLIISFLKEQNESWFFTLKKYLFEHYKAIPKEGQMIAIIILINFAIKKVSKDLLNFQQELFELYQFRDQQNNFVVNNRISENTFVNAIVMAAACQKFEWAEYFLTKYIVFLKESIREDTINLSNAYLFFYKKDYAKTIESLHTIITKNLNTELRFRSLCIRAYYELAKNNESYENLTEKQIRNFKNYCLSKNISQQRKIAYCNFCDICKALVNKKEKSKLLQKVNNMEHLMFRVWLLAKINQLKK